MKQFPEYGKIERSLMNRLLKICIVSLSMLKDFEAYRTLFTKLKKKYFIEFGFLQYGADYFYEEKAYAACKTISENDLPRYLYLENKKMESRIRKNILNFSCIFLLRISEKTQRSYYTGRVILELPITDS